MIFIQEFLYSLNDEKFYYRTLTEGGDEKKICLTKEEHNNHQYELECEMWRKIDSK